MFESPERRPVPDGAAP